MRDVFGADAAAPAATIFDHHGPAEGLADQIAGNAPNNVGIASGCKWHDQVNWAFRERCETALRQ
jgi:hypothetical protein